MHKARTRGEGSQHDEQVTTDSDKGSCRATDEPHLEEIKTQPDLERTQSRQSRIETLSRRRTRQFTHALSHVKTQEDVLVDFDGPQDAYHPLNWPFRKKVITTTLYGLTTMCTSFASAVFSPAVNALAAEYHVGPEVTLLGLSLFLVAMGIGPLLWAPISELYGRKPAVLIPYFIAAVFSFGTATAKDLQTIMITRFFTGFFGVAPVVNTGGVLGDIWSPTQRSNAIVGYSFLIVAGPTISPLIGGAIVQSYLGWRWTEYLTGIMMMSILILDVIILDETYPPRLLVFKARRLRYETGNWALHAKFEEWDVSVKELAVKFGIRPFQMLFTPVCFLMALYASFVYGLLYANLASFPIEFQEERGWKPGAISGTPFLSLLVGIIFGGVINIVNQNFYNRRFTANGNKPVPEARLPPMMIGSFFFAAGLFIFGWTSSRNIHWIGPICGNLLTGIGFLTIFQSALNYLIDTFQRYAASAVAVNTFLRSMFGAAFPLFVPAMYHHLGINWASSLFGFFGVLLIPIPFLFYIFGRQLRSRQKYSNSLGT